MKWLPIFISVIIELSKTEGLFWEKLRCSSDPDQSTTDGTAANIGRFPWLGVFQHSFTVGDHIRFAITTGVLIHPAYAIAPAEDIAKISRDQIRNNTKFIAWHSETVKYALSVRDYILHPEYEEKRTFATIALVELITNGETGIGDSPNPVLPICLPIKGAGSFSDIFAAKMTDESRELQKELFKMDFVDNEDCAKYYSNHKLNYKMMMPAFPTCAMVARPMRPCVWDGGAALITRQSWGFWSLLGFSVRGPGCGAPARFLSMSDYLPWINDMVSQQPGDTEVNMHRIGIRRISPIKLIMYSAKTVFQTGQGQCDRRQRGNVLYKDSFEVTMSKDYGQGFFYVVITQVATFTCAIVDMVQVSAKSNAAVWIEHSCEKEIRGLARGHKKPRDYARQQCFLYFKSAAFVQFRFYFSFKAIIELTMFGTEDSPRAPNPFQRYETTESWWPTDKIIKWSNFGPHYASWYNLG